MSLGYLKSVLGLFALFSFGELFAVSLSNVPTNLVVTNDNKYPVLGFFCVSAVNGLGNILDDEEIEKIELYNREW